MYWLGRGAAIEQDDVMNLGNNLVMRVVGEKKESPISFPQMTLACAKLTKKNNKKQKKLKNSQNKTITNAEKNFQNQPVLVHG